MNDQPTPYPVLAEVLASLPLLVREARRARGLSVRATAAQLGLSASTISRAETGKDLVLSHAVAMLRWLDARSDPNPVHSDTPEESA